MTEEEMKKEKNKIEAKKYECGLRGHVWGKPRSLVPGLPLCEVCESCGAIRNENVVSN